jgi:hypothetical protein
MKMKKIEGRGAWFKSHAKPKDKGVPIENNYK